MNLKKALPIIYFVSGLGVSCNIGSALCFFSGSLLMLYACLVWIKQAELRLN